MQCKHAELQTVVLMLRNTIISKPVRSIFLSSQTERPIFMTFTLHVAIQISELKVS